MTEHPSEDDLKPKLLDIIKRMFISEYELDKTPAITLRPNTYHIKGLYKGTPLELRFTLTHKESSEMHPFIVQAVDKGIAKERISR